MRSKSTRISTTYSAVGIQNSGHNHKRRSRNARQLAPQRFCPQLLPIGLCKILRRRERSLVGKLYGRTASGELGIWRQNDARTAIIWVYNLCCPITCTLSRKDDMVAYPTGVRFRGLNRAGAEYGDDWDGWTGQTFYTFPTEAELDSELAFYGNKGFNTIRLPISWERLQQSLSGPLETGYMNQVLAFANQSTAAGWLTIIDLHNYNRYATGGFDAAGVQGNTYMQHVFGDGLLETSH